MSRNKEEILGTDHVNRKRKAQRSKRHDQESIYGDTSFCKRPSSGRPGSPHRYFRDSYKVIFNSELQPTNKSGPFRNDRDASLNSEFDKAELYEGSPRSIETPCAIKVHMKEPAYQQEATGDQVVLRHLNGLCIITAGDTLKKISIHANSSLVTSTKSNVNDEVSIASVKYHVTVAPDAHSARGKQRARTKKLQPDKASKKLTALSVLADSNEPYPHPGIIRHDGMVKPNDPLCTVSLTNGMEFQLKCCVAGTVIDLNQRLSQSTVHDNTDGKSSQVNNDNDVSQAEQHEMKRGDKEDESEKRDKSVHPSPTDPSLLLSDPLLDGYLAVILPSGAFPPISRLNLAAV